MKRLLLFLALAILVHVLLTTPWRVDGTCSQAEHVKFRGIHFQFPMKVRGALKTPMSGFSRNYIWLQTDSIGGKNISGKWFFDRDNEWQKPEDITDILREKLIYGVALELYEDSCKTDQEIITEIQKDYPGNYNYHEKYDYKYFTWERDCLTIFVKRIYPDGKGYSIPEVSFCYGLSSSQATMYGKYTGFINNYPN
ncbi:hypothetical protein [Dyadobacter sp. CY323]|uniref:hypothetical protein n=1 Tax=Dyadobacter sp. CY323 TaxID=2907302 RepID=UPI001F395EEC|nr:hypothetical protein [Dyadobacter sp. CY323]MCE6988997.1 hypothetical protein [Dyadobacter sp. CY323]